MRRAVGPAVQPADGPGHHALPRGHEPRGGPADPQPVPLHPALGGRVPGQPARVGRVRAQAPGGAGAEPPPHAGGAPCAVLAWMRCTKPYQGIQVCAEVPGAQARRKRNRCHTLEGPTRARLGHCTRACQVVEVQGAVCENCVGETGCFHTGQALWCSYYASLLDCVLTMCLLACCRRPIVRTCRLQQQRGCHVVAVPSAVLRCASG